MKGRVSFPLLFAAAAAVLLLVATVATTTEAARRTSRRGGGVLRTTGPGRTPEKPVGGGGDEPGRPKLEVQSVVVVTPRKRCRAGMTRDAAGQCVRRFNLNDDHNEMMIV